MPRPKVDPQHRQRSVIACQPCKSAKIRCDSKTPCSTCIRRSREDQCVYREPDSDVTHRRKRRSTNLQRDTGDKPQPEQGPLTQNDTRPTPESSGDGDFSTNDESQGPKSRMLLSSKFQKGQCRVKSRTEQFIADLVLIVYIGETASLSYLQFVRRIVQHHVGPCTFTEGQFNNFMLESNIATGSPESSVDLTQHDRRALVQSYFDGVSSLCPPNPLDDLH